MFASLYLVRTEAAGRTKQTLILTAPSGVIGFFTTILVGWWSDRTVGMIYPTLQLLTDGICQNERMLPIVFILLPTIIGAALLVAMNRTHEKGVILFGVSISRNFVRVLSDMVCSGVYHRHLWVVALPDLCLQREQHEWPHEESDGERHDARDLLRRKHCRNRDLPAQRRAGLPSGEDIHPCPPLGGGLFVPLYAVVQPAPEQEEEAGDRTNESY